MREAGSVAQALLDDHAHMLLALDVLEKQYARIAEGERPDIDLILNVVVYLQEFSEQFHHPITGYQALAARDSAFHPA